MRLPQASDCAAMLGFLSIEGVSGEIRVAYLTASRNGLILIGDCVSDSVVETLHAQSATERNEERIDE